MKVLFVIDGMEAITAGGSERQLLELMRFVQQAGSTTELCVFRETEWLTEGVAHCLVHNLQIMRLGSLTAISTLFSLGRWIRRAGFDVVITMFWESNLVIPPVARLAGVPLIIGCRRNLNYWMSDRVAFLQSLSNRFATRLLANCEAVKRNVADRERTPATKIDVIYNGIDVESFRPDQARRRKIRAELRVADDEVLIGNSSTFRPIKGVDLFVEACATVAREHAKSRFLLVGDGPERSSLAQRIASHGLDGRFLLVGAQAEVAPYLSAMDIAVLSSRSEGFSNSILEYMAAGLACVATDVGGNREALSDTGLIVPVAVDALARSIGDLTADDLWRSRLGEAARRRAVTVFSRDVAREGFPQYLQRQLKLTPNVARPE